MIATPAMSTRRRPKRSEAIDAGNAARAAAAEPAAVTSPIVDGSNPSARR